MKKPEQEKPKRRMNLDEDFETAEQAGLTDKDFECQEKPTNLECCADCKLKGTCTITKGE